MQLIGVVEHEKVLIEPVPYDQLVECLSKEGVPADRVPVQLMGHYPLRIANRTLVLMLARPSVAANRLGYRVRRREWEVAADLYLHQPPEYVRLPFVAVVEQVRASIDAHQDAALSRVEAGYTAQEVKTWAQQQAEASAWVTDSTAAVPLLQALADRRGVPLAVVVEKIQAKAASAAHLTGIVLGSAQAANDQIEILQALNETGQLPDDWFDRLQVIASGWRQGWPSELLPKATS